MLSLQIENYLNSLYELCLANKLLQTFYRDELNDDELKAFSLVWFQASVTNFITAKSLAGFNDQIDFLKGQVPFLNNFYLEDGYLIGHNSASYNSAEILAVDWFNCFKQNDFCNSKKTNNFKFEIAAVVLSYVTTTKEFKKYFRF